MTTTKKPADLLLAERLIEEEGLGYEAIGAIRQAYTFGLREGRSLDMHCVRELLGGNGLDYDCVNALRRANKAGREARN